MRRIRKVLVWVTVMLAAAAFTGCGGKEVVMKEFQSNDGSISIMLDETWTVEDAGLDNMLVAGEPGGGDAVLVGQFVKGMYAIDSIEMLKENVEASYQLTGIESAEPIEIPGLTGIEACTAEMKDENNVSGDCYIVYGETDYAYYAFLYGTSKMNDRHVSSFKTSCASFKENVPETGSAVETTDTVRWFNAAYAILTAVNGWDYNIFGGLPYNEASMSVQQQLLLEWWEVTDKASADETLEWLMTEGHRTGFAENMQYLESEGLGEIPADERADYIFDNFEMEDQQEAQAYAEQYAIYEEKGEDALAGWDYSRAMSVISNFYIAGFYTETEALDAAYDVAVVIQKSFDSWDDFVDSYLLGYEYWAEESSDERRAVYEELKAAPDNPYSVDWNLTLEKSW